MAAFVSKSEPALTAMLVSKIVAEGTGNKGYIPDCMLAQCLTLLAQIQLATNTQCHYGTVAHIAAKLYRLLQIAALIKSLILRTCWHACKGCADFWLCSVPFLEPQKTTRYA